MIDLNAPTPAWRQTAPMAYARVYHTLTMLADGTVLAVGGEPTAGQTDQSEVSGGVLPSEIWNPTHRDVVAGGVDRRHARLPLDRGADAGRPRPRRGQRPREPRLSRSGLRPDLLAALPVQGPAPDDHLGAAASATYGSTIHGHDPGRVVDQCRQPRLARGRHAPDRHGPALRAAQLHAGRRHADRPGPASGTLRAPREVHAVHRQLGRGAVGRVAHPGRPALDRACGADGRHGQSPATAAPSVSWTAPDDGGSPITSYTVTPYIGSVAADADDRQRVPARDRDGRQRADERHGVHIHRHRDERGRSRPGIRLRRPRSRRRPPAPAFVQQVSAHKTNVSASR